MQQMLLLETLHGCILPTPNLDYVGSLSIDQVLMNALGILPYEQVRMVNLSKSEWLVAEAKAAPNKLMGAVKLSSIATHIGTARNLRVTSSCGQFPLEEEKESNSINRCSGKAGICPIEICCNEDLLTIAYLG